MCNSVKNEIWSMSTNTIYEWLKEYYMEELSEDILAYSQEKELSPEDYEEMVDGIYWDIRDIVELSTKTGNPLIDRLVSIALTSADYRAIAHKFVQVDRLNYV